VSTDELQLLRDKLHALAVELCRQSVERQEREKENFERLVQIIGEGTEELESEIRGLDEKFKQCCTFERTPEQI